MTPAGSRLLKKVDYWSSPAELFLLAMRIEHPVTEKVYLSPEYTEDIPRRRVIPFSSRWWAPNCGFLLVIVERKVLKQKHFGLDPAVVASSQILVRTP